MSYQQFLEKHYKDFDAFLARPPAHNEIDPKYKDCYDYLDILSVRPINREESKKKRVFVRGCCIYHKLNYEYVACIAR